MNVAVPMPLAMSVLLLALPAIGWLGWQLARTLAPARSARWLAPGIALSAWLVCLHASSYLLRSFSLGLVFGTLIPAFLGVLGWFGRARVPAMPADEESPPDVPRWWRWGGALVVMVLVVPAASWAFHDEINLTGHASIASQMQNGIYPPRHLTMAAYELRYHYGFDTLAAALGVLLRIPVSRAIDVLTVLSWGTCWLVLCELGPRLLRHRVGCLIAPLMLLGGGLPVVCEAAYDAPASIWVAGCVVDRTYVGPPLVSYLFQHPWGIGLPLAFTLLAVAYGRSATVWTAVVSSLLLLGLALSQLALFAPLALTLPIAKSIEAICDHRRDPAASLHRIPWRAIAVASAPSVAALAIASQLGGMFAAAPMSTSMWLVRRGPTPTWLGTLEWDLSTFGMFLPLGLIGVVLLARRRVVLPLLLLGGSMALLHLMAHKVTWDIVKLSAVAHLALALGTGEVLTRLLRRRSTFHLVSAVAALVLLTHAGIAFCAVFAFAPGAVPTDVLPRSLVRLEPDDARVVEALRARARAGDVVYRRRKRVAYGYAEWGGLPALWMDSQSQAFGFPPDAVHRRTELLRTWPQDVEAYKKEGVRWLVLDDDDGLLSAHARRWIERGEARPDMQVGALRVVELVGAPGVELPSGAPPRR